MRTSGPLSLLKAYQSLINARPSYLASFISWGQRLTWRLRLPPSFPPAPPPSTSTPSLLQYPTLSVVGPEGRARRADVDVTYQVNCSISGGVASTFDDRQLPGPPRGGAGVCGSLQQLVLPPPPTTPQPPPTSTPPPLPPSQPTTPNCMVHEKHRHCKMKITPAVWRNAVVSGESWHFPSRGRVICGDLGAVPADLTALSAPLPLDTPTAPSQSTLFIHTVSTSPSKLTHSSPHPYTRPLPPSTTKSGCCRCCCCCWQSVLALVFHRRYDSAKKKVGGWAAPDDVGIVGWQAPYCSIH